MGWLLGTTLMWLQLFCGLWNLMLVAGFEFGPLKFDDMSKKYYCSSLMVWAEKIKFDGMKRDDLEEEEVVSKVDLGRRESNGNNVELSNN